MDSNISGVKGYIKLSSDHREVFRYTANPQEK